MLKMNVGILAHMGSGGGERENERDRERVYLQFGCSVVPDSWSNVCMVFAFGIWR